MRVHAILATVHLDPCPVCDFKPCKGHYCPIHDDYWRGTWVDFGRPGLLLEKKRPPKKAL